jgi:hypothetical protein
VRSWHPGREIQMIETTAEGSRVRVATRSVQAAGLMALLAVGGPLLVLGVLAFDVATLNAVASYLVLCIWLFLTNR